MDVWLLKISEAWIEPGRKTRLYRVGMLAEALAAHGHHVTWFNSIFDHVKKCDRLLIGDQLKCNDLLTIQGLRGCTYTKSRSFRRLLHHRETAMDFRNQAAERRPPDLIYASWPTVDLAWEAVRYARTHNIPAIIDIRDLWPEVVADVAPALVRPAVRLALQPYYMLARRTLREASVVIGITEGMLSWALDFSDRRRQYRDEVFPLGYPATPTASTDPAAEAFWAERGVRGAPDQFIACYSGLFPKRIDLQTVVSAARILKQRGEHNIKFVLCGTGDLYDTLVAQASGLDNVVLPGWIDHAHIKTLMSKSAVALFPYPPRFDWIRNLPNKFFEYVAEGLPIVSCLEGEVQRQIEDNACGLMYRVHDAEDLTRAICSIRDNPQRQASMAANARALARRFDATKVYEDLVLHFEEIYAANINRVPRARPQEVHRPKELAVN